MPSFAEHSSKRVLELHAQHHLQCRLWTGSAKWVAWKQEIQHSLTARSSDTKVSEMAARVIGERALSLPLSATDYRSHSFLPDRSRVRLICLNRKWTEDTLHESCECTDSVGSGCGNGVSGPLEMSRQILVGHSLEERSVELRQKAQNSDTHNELNHSANASLAA